ncbi:MAG: acyloxyacyl hydrolase [Saprospiraceae bacterium]|nr:acyloxyacyl hydrolase [Saprospiraceae bacterium]
MRYLPKCSFITLFFILTTFGGISQSIDLGINWSYAKVIKHSVKNKYTVPPFSQTLEMNMFFQTAGNHAWESYYGRPRIGANVLYVDFGDKNVLGQAIGVFPSIDYYITRKRYFNASFQLGVGVAYLDKIYDRTENPLNNAIGSHWNNITRLNFLVEKRLFSNGSLSAGIHLTHFSNAKTKLPNSGLNIAGLSVGFLYKISDPPEKQEDIKPDPVKGKKWGGDVSGGIGISESSTAGGPRLPSYFINAGVYREVSPFFRIHAGLEYEYNEPIFQFYYHDFDPENIAAKKATHTSFYLTGEMLHDRFAFRFQLGKYLPYPDIRIDKSPVYFKLHLLTYLGNDTWKVRPFGGILLKSHLSVAQYLGFVSGINF